MMLKFNEDNLWLRNDGAIVTENGLSGFPEEGIWTADDRILAFCSQKSGGVSKLIFHGSQPQSANAFLLQSDTDALTLELILESNGEKSNIRHWFNRVKIMPYGWENIFNSNRLVVRTWFCAKKNHLIWMIRCKNQLEIPVKVRPILHLDPAGLVVKVNGRRTWREPSIRNGAIQLVAHDQLQTRTWIDVPGMKDNFIDAETILLVAGEDQDCAVHDLSIQLDSEEILPGGWGQPRFFYIVCERSENSGIEQLSKCRADQALTFEEQSRRYSHISRSHPELNVSGYSSATAIYKLAPLYTEATKVCNSGALRSSAGGYYFVWGWDSLMGGHELTRWGDQNAAKKLLHFIDTHHEIDGPVPHRFDNDLQPYHVTGFDFVSQLYISLLYHYYCETLDIDFLKARFPFARYIFETLQSQTDDRGFYRTLGMYPDAPTKLGRSSKSLVAYETGFWYCACRMVEILASHLELSEVAREAANSAIRLERNFIQYFYDPTQGFLIDALVEPREHPNGTYPRYSLFPYHNSFGAWLLRSVQENLSIFIKQELFKPDGFRMVPTWDPHINTETVTGNCWFLHFDFYCLKVFRRANDGAAIKQWLDLAENYITQKHVIPELQIMSPGAAAGEGWKGITGQIWQLFAMTGWSRGLLEGVLGLETDIGGLTYIPCGLLPDSSLTNFPFRDGRWEIQVSGAGTWVERLTVDGCDVPGVMKIPSEYYTPGSHFLEIRRTSSIPETPILLEAVGASVSQPHIEDKSLNMKISAENQVNILFFCPNRPKVSIRKQIIPANWDTKSKIGYINLPIHGLIHLKIESV